MAKMKKGLSMVLVLALLLSVFGALSVSASDDVVSIVVGAQETTKSGEDGSAVSGTDYSVNSKWNSGFEMKTGHWARYSVTAPVAGVYAVCVKVGNQSSDTGIAVETESYAAYHTVPYNKTDAIGLWGVEYDIGYVHLEKGANTMYVRCTGDGNFIYHRMTLVKVDDSYSSSLIVKDIAVDAWDDVTKSGEDGSAVSGTDYSVNSVWSNTAFLMQTDHWAKYSVTAPVAGVYAVSVKVGNNSSDAEIAVETESFAAYHTIPKNDNLWGVDYSNIGYVYLEKGANPMTVRCNGAGYFVFQSMTFTKVDDSYSSSLIVKDIAVLAQDTTKSGEDGSAVSGTDYSVNSKWNSGYLMQKDHWAKYSVTAPVTGVYAVSVKVGNNVGDAEIAVETESYAAYHTIPKNDNLWGVDYSNIGYVYLEKGANTMYVRCNGAGYFIYHKMTLVKVDDSYSSALIVKDIVIDAANEYVSTGTNGIDWYAYHNGSTIPVVNDYGIETVNNEMTKYYVNAPVAGAYSISVAARVSGEGAGLTIETDGYIADVPLTPYPGAVTTLKDFEDAGCIYLKAGENTLWVRNTCTPYYYLRKITLKKVDDDMLESDRLFVRAENYTDSEEITSTVAVRAGHNTMDWANGETLNYTVDVLKNGYYDCTIIGAIRNNFKPTLTVDGNAQYILGADGDGYVAGFADDNKVNSKVIASSIYLTKGTHTFSVNIEEPYDTTWVHGFEFTGYSQEERVLNDFNVAETKDDIKVLLDMYAEYLNIDPTTDFAGVLYPEYSYTYMIGYGYGTIDDILDAYNTIKENPLLTYQDANNTRTITAEVASNLTIGDSMIAAVYRGGQLVAVDSQIVPLMGDVEFVLENYTAEANDEFKLFVWQSMDSMIPRIY